MNIFHLYEQLFQRCLDNPGLTVELRKEVHVNGNYGKIGHAEASPPSGVYIVCVASFF